MKNKIIEGIKKVASLALLEFEKLELKEGEDKDLIDLKKKWEELITEADKRSFQWMFWSRMDKLDFLDYLSINSISKTYQPGHWRIESICKISDRFIELLNIRTVSVFWADATQRLKETKEDMKEVLEKIRP